jgi:phage terminase large subunit-like protein
MRLLDEALAFDTDGWPIWNSVVIVMPRKNGKTMLLAAYAVYRLLTSEGLPEILLAASSDKQAGRLYDAAAIFIRRSPILSGLCRVRDFAGEIVREDGKGKIIRVSSDPGRLHGYNPSLVICDELAQWTTPTLKRAYAALTSGGGARKSPQTFTITTAGEATARHDSILGRILDAGLAAEDVEKEPGLAICRLPEAKTLIFNYEAPTDDPTDIEAMKLANPASWITTEYLARQAANPELSDGDVLQLHGCVWASSEGSWLEAAPWEERKATFGFSSGEILILGYDHARTYDHAALIALRPTGERTGDVEPIEIWHPEDFDSEGIPYWLVERKISEVAEEFNVAAVGFDPGCGFKRSAEILADEGIRMVQVGMGGGVWAPLTAELRAAILEGRLRHNGDPELSAHVLAGETKDSPHGQRLHGRTPGKAKVDALMAMGIAWFTAFDTDALEQGPSPWERRAERGEALL